jgi:protein-tyrosine phosphatase
VDRGIACSLTADSLSGRFGSRPQKASAEMFRRRLVHDVASDAHDAVSRHPALSGFDRIDRLAPGVAAAKAWFTRDAPSAIVDGTDLPPAPEIGARRRRGRRFPLFRRA